MTTRANQGREFQAKLTERFIARFKDWRSVLITDSRGRLITSAADIKYGKDLGEDLFIAIRDDLPERVQKAIETRLANIGATERFW